MYLNVNSVLRDLLFILLALYFSQGFLYTTGGVLGKASLLLIFVVCIYFYVRAMLLTAEKPVFFYMVSILLCINFFGYLLGGEYSGIYHSQIRNILTALLPFFAFYYLAKVGKIKRSNLLAFFVLMLPVVIGSFYSNKESRLLLSGGNENVVNNIAYLFVFLIPFVFFWGRRQLLAFISLLVILYFIILGAKRGALVTASLGVLVFSYYQFVNTSPEKRMRGYVIALIGVVAMIAFAIDFFESNEFLVRRMQSISDGGSGRNTIYANLLSAWYNSDSLINYLFGFGFVATIDQSGTGNLAHNDWIELLVNFGVVGVVIYLLLFACVGSYILNSALPKTYRLIMLSIFGMWLLQTLFSMYYNVSGTAITMVVLGYLFGTQADNAEELS